MTEALTDRFNINLRSSSAKLPKNEEQQRKIRQLIFNTHHDDDTPFERTVDYWFAAIAWAAYHKLELPEDDSGGKEFVKIGPAGNDIRLESWRVIVLNALYLCDQEAFHVDPVDISKIDTAAGSFNEHGNPRGGSKVIANANRYALAGAMPLYGALTQSDLDATKDIRQLTAASNLKRLYEEAEKSFRSTFVKPALSRL